MKKYDLVIKTGTYQKDGETKNRYKNIGSIIEKEEGKPFMLLDPLVNLAALRREDGRDMVIVSMFKPKEEVKQEGTPQVASPEDINWQN